MTIPEKGDRYYHYKHNVEFGPDHHAYEIVGIGYHTEREEKMVIYKPLYASDFLNTIDAEYFIRPLSMFMESVLVNGRKIPRFKKIETASLFDEEKPVQEKTSDRKPPLIKKKKDDHPEDVDVHLIS